MGKKIINRKIKFDNLDNSAKNFEIIVKELENIAKEKNNTVQEVIRDFIKDLQNLLDKDYKKKILEIDLNGEISETLKKTLISYLNKAIKRYDQRDKMESQNTKKQERKEKKGSEEQEAKEKYANIEKSIIHGKSSSRIETIKKLIIDIKEGKFDRGLNKYQEKYVLQRLERLLKQEEEKANKTRKKINSIWNQIGEVVKSYARQNNTNNLECWKAIEKSLFVENNTEGLNIKIPESIETEVKELIHEKIKEEEDLLYYEQVKYFTYDFSFFRDFPEVVEACRGSSKRKFTDKKAFNRFYDLRARVQKGNNEYREISGILQKGKVDGMDRKILESRLKVLTKEHEGRN